MGKYDFDLELYDDNPLEWIVDKVQDNSIVLEFGPANGRLTKYLKETKKCMVDIVEIDEESGQDAAIYARKALLGSEKGDIEKYYWLNTEEKYDYIIFADVLEHLYLPWEVLKRCKKIIKPSGRVLVSIPNIAHNSIIIGLMKGKFEYNPTGLLDNTHIRFFTRNSFGDMVQKQGWAIVEESTRNVRVGENEIPFKYSDVSKEVYKELMNLPQGNVYQYIFSLALSNEYLVGSCERIVSIDSTSHYFIEVQYEKNGIVDYKNSVIRYFNPHDRNIRIALSNNVNDTKRAVVKLINCNAIIKINTVRALKKNGEENLHYQHNGVEVDDSIFFVYEKPSLELELPLETIKVELDFEVIKYDFDIDVIGNLLNNLQKMRVEIVRLQESINIYEKTMKEKDEEYKKSVDIYENMIQRKEKEFSESVSTYEDVIRKMKEQEIRKKKRLF